MNATTLIFIIGAMLVLTLVLMVVLKVRCISPRSRYTTFAILLGVGVSAEVAVAVAALVSQRPGVAALSFAALLLLGVACALEMRKLRREF